MQPLPEDATPRPRFYLLPVRLSAMLALVLSAIGISGRGCPRHAIDGDETTPCDGDVLAIVMFRARSAGDTNRADDSVEVGVTLEAR